VPNPPYTRPARAFSIISDNVHMTSDDEAGRARAVHAHARRTPCGAHPRPSYVDAAGLALVGETAYQGLSDLCELKPGQAVFVNVRSTSLSAIAIRYAKALRIIVWASALRGPCEHHAKTGSLRHADAHLLVRRSRETASASHACHGRVRAATHDARCGVRSRWADARGPARRRDSGWGTLSCICT
jgi:hypothetical protein